MSKLRTLCSPVASLASMRDPLVVVQMGAAMFRPSAVFIARNFSIKRPTVPNMEAIKSSARALDDRALRVEIESGTAGGKELDREEVADLISEVAAPEKVLTLLDEGIAGVKGLFSVVARLSEYTDVNVIDDTGKAQQGIKEFTALSALFSRVSKGRNLYPIGNLYDLLLTDPINTRNHFTRYLEQGYNINVVIIPSTSEGRHAVKTPVLNLFMAQEAFASDVLDDLLVTAFSAKALDVNVRDFEEKTGFSLAAKMRNTNLVELFLMNEHNLRVPVEVDAQDKDGRSAMHYAYLYGDDMMIYTLQKAGAREDLLDKDGRTPEDLLRLDIADSVKEVVSTLASIEIDAYRPECARHNADIDCPDTGRTLLDLIKEQRREALEALIDVSKGKGC